MNMQMLGSDLKAWLRRRVGLKRGFHPAQRAQRSERN